MRRALYSYGTTLKHGVRFWGGKTIKEYITLYSLYYSGSLNLWGSCPYILKAKITSMHYRTQLIPCWDEVGVSHMLSKHSTNLAPSPVCQLVSFDRVSFCISDWPGNRWDRPAFPSCAGSASIRAVLSSAHYVTF